MLLRTKIDRRIDRLRKDGTLDLIDSILVSAQFYAELRQEFKMTTQIKLQSEEYIEYHFVKIRPYSALQGFDMINFILPKNIS